MKFDTTLRNLRPACLAAGLAMAAGLASAQDVVTLRFASFTGPTNFLNTGLLMPWFEKLEAESGGRLKVEFVTGGSAAAPAEVFDSVEAGLIDIGWSITSYNPGRFSAASVTELPLLATGSGESSVAIAALYDQGLLDGFDTVKVLGIATADIARVHHAREISGLEDLRGAKVRAAGSVLSQMVTAIGATPVGMPAPAMAEALAKNVVDAAAADWFAVEGFSLLDVTHSHIDVSQGTTPMYVVMNRQVYDGLPPEVRGAAVVSVPFDLARSARAIDGPGFWSWVYRERFLRRLRAKALEKAARFPDRLDAAAIRAVTTFAGFDGAVTAPLHGFASAEDYWARCSAGRFVAGVRRPLLALAALDDPMVPGDTLPVEAARANPRVELVATTAGGHVGFVSGAPWWPSFWAELRAAAFAAELTGAAPQAVQAG
jgi:TRAP-type C4-dicarboxylate transport system substrate-binding protein